MLENRKKTVLGMVLVSLGISWASAHASTEYVTNRFGFVGKEIFPVDQQISSLRNADLDGDGLQDLVVVNNLRSKINLLYNRTGQTNTSSTEKRSGRRELNELPPDSRFRIDSIASEKRISSIVVADLNNDKKPDIAYYGEPRELVVLYNEGTNNWSAPKRWPIDDGLLNPNALVHGDLNGDKRNDLLLLADGFVYWLKQDKENALSEPEKIPYYGSIQAVQVLDIQGDGKEDLLLCNWDNINPFRFRLQSSSGRLGPEIHFTLPSIRSYWADDLDADSKTEVITIAQKSGRAQISQFAQKTAEPLSGKWQRGQFQLLALKKTSKAKRGMAWADINGDKFSDLLVAEPESGQLTVYLQDKEGGLGDSKTFATLTGINELAVGDWNGDGKAEIFVLSQDERQIGVTSMDENGRIGFPKILPFQGRPLTMVFGAIAEDNAPSLIAITDVDGKRELQSMSSNGELKQNKMSESFKSTPRSIVVHDVNQDGRNDIVVLIPYEKLKLLIRGEKEEFTELDIAPPGGSVEQPWLSVADVDGDGKTELLLAQNNFVRAVVLQRSKEKTAGSAWGFDVKEQINGVASNSRIIGAAALTNGVNPVASIFLLDAERKILTLCERDKSGVWQVVRNIPLPATDFKSLQAISYEGSEPNSIAFLGDNAVAWMTFSGQIWELAELDGYESPIRDAYLHDVVSGDLNNDKRKDLVFLETGKSYLDVVTYEKPNQLVPANRWQVFEERTFRNRRADASEPREALVADFNNDGKNDLAVIVHDRIILYPQE